MKMKMTEPGDNSKVLFDITCCIIDITTKLAAKESCIHGLVESETLLKKVKVY